MEKDNSYTIKDSERFIVKVCGQKQYIFKNNKDGKFWTGRHYGYYDTAEEAINEVKRW